MLVRPRKPPFCRWSATLFSARSRVSHHIGLWRTHVYLLMPFVYVSNFKFLWTSWGHGHRSCFSDSTGPHYSGYHTWYILSYGRYVWFENPSAPIVTSICISILYNTIIQMFGRGRASSRLRSLLINPALVLVFGDRSCQACRNYLTCRDYQQSSDNESNRNNSCLGLRTVRCAHWRQAIQKHRDAIDWSKRQQHNRILSPLTVGSRVNAIFAPVSIM
jgi:hypothetical protein